MAYAHTQYEVLLTNAAAVSTTGDKATWVPGYVPSLIRAWAYVVTTAFSAVAKLDLDKQPTSGSATGRVADFVSPLNIPNPTAQGKVVYKDGLQAKVNPGEQIVFNVTTAAAAGAGSAVMMVEPTWEMPGNNSNMILTA